MKEQTDEPELGPAMRSLTPKQRAFIMAMASDPKGTQADWAKAAGYATTSGSHEVAACRMLRDPRIEAAIFEVARSNLNTFGPMLAARGMLKIAADEKHPGHERMLLAVADRVGLHPKSEHRVTVEHRNDAEMAKLALRLANEIGVRPESLLGANHPLLASPNLIEAQAVEVERAAQPEKPDFNAGEKNTGYPSPDFD